MFARLHCNGCSRSRYCGAEEAVKGAIAPANTPAGSAAKAAQPAPATNYQLMLAHIVGGQYRSPTLGQQGDQGSPPAQKGCTYTPYLLASPAGAHALSFT